jgi:hypothetical protein
MLDAKLQGDVPTQCHQMRQRHSRLRRRDDLPQASLRVNVMATGSYCGNADSGLIVRAREQSTRNDQARTRREPELCHPRIAFPELHKRGPLTPGVCRIASQDHIAQGIGAEAATMAHGRIAGETVDIVEGAGEVPQTNAEFAVIRRRRGQASEPPATIAPTMGSAEMLLISAGSRNTRTPHPPQTSSRSRNIASIRASSSSQSSALSISVADLPDLGPERR